APLISSAYSAYTIKPLASQYLRSSRSWFSQVWEPFEVLTRRKLRLSRQHGLHVRGDPQAVAVHAISDVTGELPFDLQHVNGLVVLVPDVLLDPPPRQA